MIGSSKKSTKAAAILEKQDLKVEGSKRNSSSVSIVPKEFQEKELLQRSEKQEV